MQLARLSHRDRLAEEAGATVVFPQGGLGAGRDFHRDPRKDRAHLDAVRAEVGEGGRREVDATAAIRRFHLRHAAAR